MSLTESQINENKERFLSLINQIEREGLKKESLLNQLNYSDFFVAPASVKYHADYKGGLCAHCLHVYDTLIKFVKDAYPDRIEESTDEDGNVTTTTISTSPYSDETLIIVALLHDFSKMKFYKVDMKNTKKYSEDGSGSKKECVDGEWKTYDWVAEPFYKVRDVEDRFIFGNHSENALFMVQAFMPLSVEEAAAILNHMGVQSGMTTMDANSVSEVYGKFTLATLLHLADMFATFILDGRNESNN